MTGGACEQIDLRGAEKKGEMTAISAAIANIGDVSCCWRSI